MTNPIQAGPLSFQPVFNSMYLSSIITLDSFPLFQFFVLHYPESFPLSKGTSLISIVAKREFCFKFMVHQRGAIPIIEFAQSLRQPTGITGTPFSVVYAIGAFAQMIINRDGSLYTGFG